MASVAISRNDARGEGVPTLAALIGWWLDSASFMVPSMAGW